MADWPARGDAQRIETHGEVTASSAFTSITAHASADTKGSYTELVASTSFDSQGIWVNTGVDSLNRQFLVDIAIGAAASEQVIIPNISYDHFAREWGDVVYFPISIPAGTRIAARCQSSIGGSQLTAGVMLEAQGFLPSSPLGRVADIGTDSANSTGTVIDPGGVAHTKGSWVEMTASTGFDIKQMNILTGGNANSTLTTANMLIDVAVGAGGSEQVIIPDLMLKAGALQDMFLPHSYPLFSSNIPAGTRLAARAQSSTTNATDRLFTLLFYGIG